MKNIVNIVNFVRGCEPRMDMDLITPIKENIRILSRYGLKSTFLLQYDALKNKEMIDLISESGDIFEKGAWFEMTDGLAREAGIEWRGRYSWDYHANVDMLVGYTVDERRRIIDAYMEKFRMVFGKYPKSAGSWCLDSRSMDYMSEKYGMSAFCDCRDQHGTDGYSLWGAYYNHGYYPSKFNEMCPAVNLENQINTPLFRMLGSDMIHQYDDCLIDENGEIRPKAAQTVVTLEPAYNSTVKGGGAPSWVNWYLKENYKEDHLGFNYTQAGQENSFGWFPYGKAYDVSSGLNYQYSVFKYLSDEGILEVMTLGETGEWFKNTYKESPTCSVSALTDWSDKNYRSYWFYNKHYRINFIEQNGRFWIRDMNLYRDDFKSPYYDKVETRTHLYCEALPFIDGFRFSGDNVRAGGYFKDKEGNEITASSLSYRNIDKDSAVITSGEISVTCSMNSLDIRCQKDFDLILVRTKLNIEITDKTAKEVFLKYKGFDYSVKLESGCFIITNDELSISSENGKIKIIF